VKIYRVFLSPKAKINIFPGSDTLFGAICWGIRWIYGEDKLESLLNDFFNHKRRFLISSVFPVLVRDNMRVYFFPMPKLPGLTLEEVKELAKVYEDKFGRDYKYSLVKLKEELKMFEEAEMLSEGLFEKIVRGEKSFKDLFEDYYKGKQIMDYESHTFCPANLGGEVKIIGKWLMNNKEFCDIFREKRPPTVISFKVSQRNKIDRFTNSTSGAGQIFYSDEIFLKSSLIKLYFLIQTEDISYFLPIFRWLSDTGIGGDRTSGKGQFQLSDEPEEIELWAVDKPNYFVALSRYLPQKDEIDLSKEKINYDIISYRSKVETSVFRSADIWKNRIMYFKEGSIFPINRKKEFYGQLAKVKQIGKKVIYQNGLAFPVFSLIKGK